MIIARKESWGELRYHLPEHVFSCHLSAPTEATPYTTLPVVLNVDLTFRCNMRCLHCVAHDLADRLGGVDNADLRVSDDLIMNINKSPFMVIVITGGEPLLEQYRETLRYLIRGLERKGIVIDTNGTIYPDMETVQLLRDKEAMVRVSWDVPHPNEECQLRVYDAQMFASHLEYMQAKEMLLQYLVAHNITVGIQTVLHKRNYSDRGLLDMPKKLAQLSIRKWYIQRFIPSHTLKYSNKYVLSPDKYEWAVERITKAARRNHVTCYTKRDRRHNSVFLLVKDGDLFTQSDERPGQKIYLGRLGEIQEYFSLVSAPDHTVRYCPRLCDDE